MPALLRKVARLLQPSFIFLNEDKVKDFEPHWADIGKKKRAIEHYFKEMKDQIVLRLSPIIIGVNDSEVEEILRWFKSICGEKVIIHFLRETNPELKKMIHKWNGVVPSKCDDFYTESQMIPIIEKLCKFELKLTICAEFELNKKYGYTDDCCFL